MSWVRSFLGILLLGIIVYSCNAEEDICQSSESTPRMKVKFKTQSTGKLKTLDSIFVVADLGAGFAPVIAQKYRTDSIYLPVRIDGTPFTRYQVSLSRGSKTSTLELNYTTERVYVSPACGYKMVYHNLAASADANGSLKGAEVATQNILDENKTHLYLLF